ERHTNQQSDQRRNDGPIDEREPAELTFNGIPLAAGQEPETELLDRKRGMPSQRSYHRDNNHDHQQRCSEHRRTKDRVAEIAGGRKPLAPIRHETYRSGFPPEVIELIFASARFTISAGSGAYCKSFSNDSPS